MDLFYRCLSVNMQGLKWGSYKDGGGYQDLYSGGGPGLGPCNQGVTGPCTGETSYNDPPPLPGLFGLKNVTQWLVRLL